MYYGNTSLTTGIRIRISNFQLIGVKRRVSLRKHEVKAIIAARWRKCRTDRPFLDFKNRSSPTIYQQWHFPFFFIFSRQIYLLQGSDKSDRRAPLQSPYNWYAFFLICRFLFKVSNYWRPSVYPSVIKKKNRPWIGGLHWRLAF